MNIAAYVHLRRSLGNATGVGGTSATWWACWADSRVCSVTVMTPRAR